MANARAVAWYRWPGIVHVRKNFTLTFCYFSVSVAAYFPEASHARRSAILHYLSSFAEHRGLVSKDEDGN
ncbi:hypothetical protein KFK09_013714 [Dendrobium nobile]|uniref:Uncharacterized protein n=1 Tax=Dendrobium nobile TaxID=94219 RepID=A0A8T3B9W0_DENNO|nr:hypothetical protein KFK09_013714 [Dendrobium nobile]